MRGFNNERARSRVLNCKILIIDETSMISAHLVEVLDRLFRLVWGSENLFDGI